MHSKTWLRIWAILIALASTATALLYPFDKVEAPSPEKYDQNSRKNLIPEDCKTFFDGCNRCSKMEGNEEAACTRMFCENYEKPYCTDEETIENPEVKNKENVLTCNESDPFSQCEISEELWEPTNKFISREEAEKLILDWKIKTIFQKHNLEVSLSTDKEEFKTKEPTIDEVFETVKKCGQTCETISLATE